MRMVLVLSEAERQALRVMSERDMRFPREQIRFLLLQEAKRRGLLPADDMPDDRPAQEVHHAQAS